MRCLILYTLENKLLIWPRVVQADKMNSVIQDLKKSVVKDKEELRRQTAALGRLVTPFSVWHSRGP